MIRTYLDAGVLIAAARAADRGLAAAALNLLDDAGREFISSDYVRLEVMPKALYYGADSEAKLYEAYFASCVKHVGMEASHFDSAYGHAVRYGLAAFDALHLAAAIVVGCQEFVTTERSSSPLFRFPDLKIVGLRG